MSIKVSIAVLTYNHEKYIKQSLDSILNQNVDFEYEIIIGEDCSTDGSREILEEYKNKYKDKINLILRKENIGVIKNYLDVLSKCKGDYIAFLETDDYWTDMNKLQTQVNYLEKNLDYSGIYYRVKKIDLENQEIGYLPSERKKNENLDYSNYNDVLYNKNYSIPSFGLMFRNIYKDGITPELEKYYSYSKWLGDYPNSVILSNYGKIKYEDRVCGCYRYITSGGDNYSSQGLLKIEDYLRFLNGMEKIYDYKFSKEKKYIEKYAKHELMYLKYLLKEKKIKKILKYLLKEKKYKIYTYGIILFKNIFRKG